jgi:hypothetical protein
MELIQSPGDAKPHLIKLLRACMAGGMNAYEALNVLQTALDDVKARPHIYLGTTNPNAGLTLGAKASVDECLG